MTGNNSNNNGSSGSKQIKYGNDARSALARGIDKVANAVKTTLGPGGRLVVLARRWGVGTVTKDGVSVAREISLPDPFENEGAKQCIEVASQCNVDAGDGTTSSVVLAQALIEEGMKRVESGTVRIPHLVQDLERDTELVLAYIDRHAQPVTTEDEIRHVATISGNNASVGDVIGQAFTEVGVEGCVSMETWAGDHVKLDFAEGYSFERGFINPYFVNVPDRMRVEYADCLVAVVCQGLRWGIEAVKLLEFCTHYKQPLIVVCEDCEGEALETFLMNHVQGSHLPVCVVKGAGYGQRQRDLLEDLAVFVGATPVATEFGMDFTGTLPKTIVGRAARVVVDSENTTFFSASSNNGGKSPAPKNEDGTGDDVVVGEMVAGVQLEQQQQMQAVLDRCTQLRTLLDNAQSELDRMKYQERLTRLTAGAAVIRVGASTETELTELKHRYEDALNATRAALKEGIVVGGGVTLVEASKELAEDSLLRTALHAPCKQIAYNAGADGEDILRRMLDPYPAQPGTGYNARTNTWGCLKAAGVIDPALVTKSSLKNAVSIAKLVLNCETVIVPLPPDTATSVAGGGG